MRAVLCWVGVLWAGACGAVDNEPTCPIGQLDCAGTCVDTLNNNANCGACGAACDSGLVCGNGACAVTCPVGQEICDGACVDLQSSLSDCGACGAACGADQECRAGVCETPCAEFLVAPATADSWGLTWDGLQRDALPLAQAVVACEMFGGRLPTATEVYRASAQQSGDVGQGFDTAPLWTQVPADDLDQVTSRLSDGAATETAANTAAPFRCVCAPPPPPFFTAERCNGPAGAPCVALGNRNLDVEDRPALRHASALWECAHELAHVADSTTLIEASGAGVVGSNEFVQTADRWDHYRITTLRWTTSAWSPNYGAGGNHYVVNADAAAPFRCVGPGAAVGVFPNAVTGALAPPVTGYTLDDSDRAAVAWTGALDACTAAGGHLARSAELAEGLYGGLDNGAGVEVWTADEVGANNGFLVATLRWNDRSPRFPYVFTNTATTPITWQYKHGAPSPTRCVYYPLDPAVVAPGACNGTCFELALAGATPATMWFDGLDRAPANYGAAIADCANEGGHLASPRDLAEAIRGGLPGGTNEWVWGADIGQSNGMLVRWSEVNTAFNPISGQGSIDWSGLTTARAYRCMWTNEVR